MNNTVTIGVEFYFKGQKISPSVVIDLDKRIEIISGFDSIYSLLAKSNNIDVYSYEYEMMLAEDLIFSDATGLAKDFLENGKFDLVAFKQALDDESITEVISKVASDYLSMDDLSLQPDIKAALLEAYKQGRKSQ